MIIKLSGGLGNQLFQYAFGRALEKEYEVPILYDEGNYRKDKKRQVEIRGICPNYKSLSLFHSQLWKIKNKIGRDKFFRIYKEKGVFEYHNVEKHYAYLNGYWQHQNYFNHIRDLLVKEIVFNDILNNEQKHIVATMHQENAIAVHVRRGDYLQLTDFYVVLGIEYYKKAMKYLEEEYKICKFYIFSDDMAWCRENLSGNDNCIFIDKDISNTALSDFEMMRNCKGFIIANSTFSWWSSWLSEASDKKMIAPKQWFCDKHAQEHVIDALLREYILL